MAAIMDGYHHIPVRLLAIYGMKKYALHYYEYLPSVAPFINQVRYLFFIYEYS